MICKYLNSSLYKGARPNTFIFRAGRTEFPAMEGRTFSLNDLYNFCEKNNIEELTCDEITMYGRIKRNVRDNLRLSLQQAKDAVDRDEKEAAAEAAAKEKKERDDMGEEDKQLASSSSTTGTSNTEEVASSAAETSETEQQQSTKQQEVQQAQEEQLPEQLPDLPQLVDISTNPGIYVFKDQFMLKIGCFGIAR